MQFTYKNLQHLVFNLRSLIPFLLLFLLLGCARFQRVPAYEIIAADIQVAEEEGEGLEIVLASFSEDFVYGDLIAEDSIAEDLAEDFIEDPASPPRFALVPGNARPGEPVTIGFSYNFEADRDFHAVLLDSRQRRIARALFFFTGWRDEDQEVRTAILAVPSTALIGDAFIRIESGGYVIRDIPFTIDHRVFHSETIALDQANTALRTTVDPRRALESQQLWAILNRTGREILHMAPFERPLDERWTRRTSMFGSRRVFLYVDGTSDTAIHAGVDYGVPTGTEIWASAGGRVVFARNRLITGNSVIIEHLPGVYSLYYHLDTIAVTEGSLITTGTYLGRSGATGLATGPHLHWEIRVSGENADPDAFLTRTLLDKNYIISRLIEY